jgi:hypothetical protein
MDRVRAFLTDYVQALAALDSADKIAAHLRSRGIKAWCGNSERCALVQDLTNYLVERGVTPLAIEADGVDFYLGFDGDVSVTHAIPPMIQDFILGFDEGRYGELISEEDAAGLYLAAARKAAA